MKVFSIFFFIIGLFILFGCSTNENTPLEPDPPGEPLKLTVTYDQIYYILKCIRRANVDVLS